MKKVEKILIKFGYLIHYYAFLCCIKKKQKFVFGVFESLVWLFATGSVINEKLKICRDLMGEGRRF